MDGGYFKAVGACKVALCRNVSGQNSRFTAFN